jgi:hypothetical protein
MLFDRLHLEKLATKAQRHKAKLFAIIYLCVLASWWRKFISTKDVKIFTNPDEPGKNDQ